MIDRNRILIVDDNPINMEVLQEMLSDDYELLSASNGQQALDLARKFKPGIVLLDLMMPGLDGYEVCRRLRASPETAAARIIIISAKAMATERKAGMAAGADAYIAKPFDYSDLLAAMLQSPAPA